MGLGWSVLHGPNQTILGALLIAGLLAWVAASICIPISRRHNPEVAFCKQKWLLEPEEVIRTAVLTGAHFSALSHLILDSLRHHDTHPLAPFTSANPLLDLVLHGGVYRRCVALEAAGALACLGRRGHCGCADSATMLTSGDPHG